MHPALKFLNETLAIALLVAVVWAFAPSVKEPTALCGTDSECAELCPVGDNDCRANILD